MSVDLQRNCMDKEVLSIALVKLVEGIEPVLEVVEYGFANFEVYFFGRNFHRRFLFAGLHLAANDFDERETMFSEISKNLEDVV